MAWWPALAWLHLSRSVSLLSHTAAGSSQQEGEMILQAITCVLPDAFQTGERLWTEPMQNKAQLRSDPCFIWTAAFDAKWRLRGSFNVCSHINPCKGSGSCLTGTGTVTATQKHCFSTVAGDNTLPRPTAGVFSITAIWNVHWNWQIFSRLQQQVDKLKADDFCC